MTKLKLLPNSEELNTILYNKFLFDFYTKMLVEDFEIEMSKFKYLAMITNVDTYRKVEEHNNPNILQDKVAQRLYKDGDEATAEISKLYIEEDNTLESE